MAVDPGVLLPPTPDINLRVVAVKTPQSQSEPSDDKLFNFSDLYVQETAKQPANSIDGLVKDTWKEPKDIEKDAAAENPADIVAQLIIAEDGKLLPVEEQAQVDEEETDTASDPLYLPSLVEPLPLNEPPESLSVVSTTPASLTEASNGPLLLKLNEVPMGTMALKQRAEDREQTQIVKSRALIMKESEVVRPFGRSQSDTIDAPIDRLSRTIEGKSLGVQLPQSISPTAASVLPENLLESKAEAYDEPFAVKLNGLTQAMAQPTLTNRPVNDQVPGQPMAIQLNGWSEALVERMMWMSSQNLKSAEIQLDPAELGQLEVRIHVTTEQTQVTFASPNAIVRDALENQIYRLRDMFTQQGMNHLDVSVSDQSLARGWQGSQGNKSGSAHVSGSRDSTDGDDESLIGDIRGRPGTVVRRLVDYYA